MFEFKYEDFRAFEKKSYAKLEFLALEQDIFPLLSKGVSAKAIYRYFEDKGRLTMCYQTFSRYMRGQCGGIQAQTAARPHVPETPSFSWQLQRFLFKLWS